MIFRNAEDGVPYDGIALISGVFRRENAVLPYGVAADFSCFSVQFDSDFIINSGLCRVKT